MKYLSFSQTKITTAKYFTEADLEAQTRPGPQARPHPRPRTGTWISAKYFTRRNHLWNKSQIEGGGLWNQSQTTAK